MTRHRWATRGAQVHARPAAGSPSDDGLMLNTTGRPVASSAARIRAKPVISYLRVSVPAGRRPG